MTISVNDAFDKVEIKEDQRTEFKRSLFFDAVTHQPSFKQMIVIADTMAAFMNADGGMLYIGISDDKQPIGIQDDLDVLEHNPELVVARSARGNDEQYSYSGTTDKYEIKLRQIVKAHMSANAAQYVGSVRFAIIGGKQICRIECKPCRPDEIVYVYHRYSPRAPEVAEIFLRTGNQKGKLDGIPRDEFVRRRYGQSLLGQMSAMKADVPSLSTDALLDGIRVLLSEKKVGSEVIVEGGQPITEEGLSPIKSPKGLVFDGKHVADVSSWKDCYLKLIVLLNGLDSTKFDNLPDAEFFSKWFKREQPKAPGMKRRPKCTGCYQGGLGSRSDVRAVEVPGKVYFTNPSYIVHRLLDAVGVDANRVMVRA